ncbi:TetR family regulatory protein [Streptomyces himastatinicus ATCC 53653]|uniref:TetR family regulatory protein n=1 Tax=Streptomyces himastatinicus ATCC 53653 TaxID=457427 RepID=D9WKY5_9ACTN|nr:TetR family transcriptional regulator [Streptomyces himastatinicus]EFL29260.1 TetR family regulatory protein [Streptomyces himastatinicus ATCC 53653]
MAYDSAATKERIITAATAEFAAHGVAGARVDRIATAAKANKRALYDYFGDKNKLFAVVLERRLAELAEAVPPSEDLPGYAEQLFDYHRTHPEALRLVMWEALEAGEGPVPAEEERTLHYGDKVAAAQAGDPDDDARARVFFTLALASWSVAMPQLRRMVLGPDFGMDELRQEIARTVASFPANTSRR